MFSHKQIILEQAQIMRWLWMEYGIAKKLDNIALRFPYFYKLQSSLFQKPRK